MTQEQWTAVDHYINDLLVRPDAPLQTALDEILKARMPSKSCFARPGQVASTVGTRPRGAEHPEIGTLGGYSTICLARGPSEGGRVVTLESNAGHAEIARANIARAGLAEVVEIRVGPALDTLPQLAAEKSHPFDFTFIDADKISNEPYLSRALELSDTGTVIIADNVVRGGAAR